MCPVKVMQQLILDQYSVFQVTIWVEKHTGQVVCTSTLRCPSDQAGAASETFSEHTSSLTQATFATSTMVGGLNFIDKFAACT